MKKKLLLLGMILLLGWGQSFSQVLNQPANWPNAGWSLTGTYSAADLLADPTVDQNLSYDDDGAGSTSTDVIEAASPVIDLTAAQTAGEVYLYIDYEHDYNAGNSYQFEYWDADAGVWVLWETLPDNSNATSAWCSQLTGVQTTSQQLDISGFTATQLSGFQYRVYYNASSTWGWGFCMSSPTIYSASCPAPTNLAASNTTSNSVDLAWTNGGTETQWNIEYGPTGFTPGTGTVVAAGSNPFTLTGLNPTTTYDVYVQADCGGGDVSSWSGSETFSTLLAPLVCSSGLNTYLFSSDFETSFPASWTNTATGNPQWGYNTGGTGSFGTGPSAAHSGTGYIYLETSGGTLGDADTIYPSSSLDLTQALNDARITFYYHMFGADMGDLIVQVSNDGGATWTTEFSQSGQVQTAETDSWLPVNISLNAYIGSMIDYRVIGVRGNGFGGDMAIDLFNIETCVSCPQPTAINISNITSSTADVDWQIGNSETQWIIEYGTANFVPGTGDTMVTTNNPETLTGLMDNTEYDVYIRAICGPGDTSSYSVPGSFITECVAISPIGFCESFDSNSSTQNCWTVLDVNGDGDVWDMDYTFNTNNGDETAVLYTDFNGGSNDDWLITPQISLNSNEVMNFFYRVQSSGEPNDFEVLLSTTGKNPADFQDTLMYLASYSNTSYLDTTLDLTAFSGDVYVAFHIPSGGLDGWRLYIDDVCFDACIPASGQDGSTDICRADGTADLNSLIVKGQENGGWMYPNNQQLIVDDTLFNVSNLPAGDYEVLYVVEGGCTNDTTVATVTVFPPSSAGQDGTLEVCQNQPINLFDGLNGNVDLGGTWLDPSNNPIAGSQPVASAIPGSYNFDYITSNGVCAADTSLVEVVVRPDCDYLSLGEEKLNELTVFPNPATNVINIANPSNSESLRVEILDMNGRVVLTDAKALANATEGTIDVSHLVNGMYTLRVYNEEGQKTFKVVKQ